MNRMSNGPDRQWTGRPTVQTYGRIREADEVDRSTGWPTNKGCPGIGKNRFLKNGHRWFHLPYSTPLFHFIVAQKGVFFKINIRSSDNIFCLWRGTRARSEPVGHQPQTKTLAAEGDRWLVTVTSVTAQRWGCPLRWCTWRQCPGSLRSRARPPPVGAWAREKRGERSREGGKQPGNERACGPRNGWPTKGGGRGPLSRLWRQERPLGARRWLYGADLGVERPY